MANLRIAIPLVGWLVLALLGAAPAAAEFATAPGTSPPVVTAGTPSVTGELPPPDSEVPPGSLGDDPYVYVFDLAWTASEVHLTLRNAGGAMARARVVHARTQQAPDAAEPFTYLGESHRIAPGRAAHASFDVRRHHATALPIDYVVVASDRPLLVGGRALDKKYGHQLLPFAIDCAGSGDAEDDGAPYGRVCWIAKHL